MPIPFIIGIGAAIASAASGVAATAGAAATTAAAVGAAAAGTVAGKVAIGVAAGAIISCVFAVKVTARSLETEVERIKQEDASLRKKQLEARITNIFETGDFPIIKVGLYEDGNHLEEVEVEAKKGIDRNEIYVGRSWMVYS